MSRLDLSHPVTQDDHVIGNPNAVVQLVEYGDYECPYCAEAFNIVDQLREHFGNDLLYIFRNYPLSEIHPDALRAAEAAEAAAKQGKFLEMQKTLFENQGDLERDSLVQYAELLGLDTQRFENEIRAHAHRSTIRQDLQSGNASDVDGTPSFFLNGIAYKGATDLETMIADIEEIIAHQTSSKKSA